MGAIHYGKIAWDAMEQVTKSFESIEEAKKKALEANEIAQTYLKPKPTLEEGEGDEAPPPPPPLVIYQNFPIYSKIII